MRLLRLSLGAAAALVAMTGSAHACADGRGSYYFFDHPPERHAETPMLRVRITRIRGSVVTADLDGPFARLSPDGTVRILLPSMPGTGIGCVMLGPTDRPVFVIGALVQYASGALELRAMPSQAVVIPGVRRTPDPARYDRYIVDPAYLSPEERRRREERQ
jgi:hypothetical protein